MTRDKISKIIYTAVLTMILTIILFSITNNEIVHRIGIFIIVFSSVLFFSNFTKKYSRYKKDT